MTLEYIYYLHVHISSIEVTANTTVLPFYYHCLCIIIIVIIMISLSLYLPLSRYSLAKYFRLNYFTWFIKTVETKFYVKDTPRLGILRIECKSLIVEING